MIWVDQRNHKGPIYKGWQENETEVGDAMSESRGQRERKLEDARLLLVNMEKGQDPGVEVAS